MRPSRAQRGAATTAARIQATLTEHKVKTLLNR